MKHHPTRKYHRCSPFWYTVLFCSVFLFDFGFGQQRCELTFKDCIEMDTSNIITNLVVPSNVTRIKEDAISICVRGSLRRPNVNIMFVVDQSGSMATQDANYYAFDATNIAITSVKNLSPESQVGLMPFASEICRSENELLDLNNSTEYQELLNIAQNDIADGEGPAEDPNAGNYQNLPGTSKLGCGAARNGSNQGFGTNYRDPLDSAYNVLRGAPAGEPVAVIFITDGEPSNTGDPSEEDRYNSWNGKYAEIPVHSIYIGGSQTGAAANRLIALGDNTGSSNNRGSYNPIADNDSLALVNILDSVINTVLGISKPVLSLVQNVTTGKNVVIDSASHDSVDTDLYQLDMKSPMAVNEGVNQINIATRSQSDQDSTNDIGHSIFLSLTGSPGSQPDSIFNITCSDPAAITAHNPNFNQQILQLTGLETQFGVRLSGADQDLGTTDADILGALSLDSENVSLPKSGSNYQAVVPFATSTALKANGTVEALITGDVLNLRWEHPHDPRDTAVLALPVADARPVVNVKITDMDGNEITEIYDDENKKFLVEVTYVNTTVSNIGVVSNTGDAETIALTQISPGVGRSEVTYAFVQSVLAGNTIVEGVDPGTKEKSMTLTVTGGGVSKNLTIRASYIDIVIKDGTGNIVDSLDRSVDSIFYVEIITVGNIDPIDSMLIVTDDHDSEYVPVDSVLDTPGKYLAVVKYTYVDNVNPWNNVIENKNDGPEEGDSTDIITVIVNDEKEDLKITSSFVQAEKAEIFDKNRDGHGDSIVITFEKALKTLPDTIYNINWPGDGSKTPIAVKDVDIFSLDPSGKKLTIVFSEEKVLDFGMTSVKGVPTLTLPDNPTFGGAIVVIEDKIGAVITSIDKKSAENSGYFEIVPGAIPGTKDTVPKTFPDTLTIVLSEPIIAIPGVPTPWEALLIYQVEGTLEWDTVRVVGAPIQVDSVTWKVLIPPGASNGVPANNELVALNPLAPYVDANLNYSGEHSERTVATIYDPININAKLINPVVGDSIYDDYSLCNDSAQIQENGVFIGKTDKCTEEYIILPHGMDAFGNVNPDVQRSCRANNIKLVEQDPVIVDNNCLIMIRVITEEAVAYDAQIQIYDHLGLAINSFVQPNGFCGEFEEERYQRRTVINGKTSYKTWLVWNQMDFKGDYVNSGVFIWKVHFKFADGRGQTKLFKSGIARSEKPEPGCWLQ